MEPPEPFINAVNFDSSRAALARFVNDHTLQRDHRQRYADAIRHKLAALFQIRRQLFMEEVWRRDHIVSPA
jgi:hypothetical protein